MSDTQNGCSLKSRKRKAGLNGIATLTPYFMHQCTKWTWMWNPVNTGLLQRLLQHGKGHTLKMWQCMKYTHDLYYVVSDFTITTDIEDLPIARKIKHVHDSNFTRNIYISKCDCQMNDNPDAQNQKSASLTWRFIFNFRANESSSCATIHCFRQECQ